MEETTTRQITDIEAILGELPTEDRKRFEQIYQISRATGRLKAPADMHGCGSRDGLAPWTQSRPSTS